MRNEKKDAGGRRASGGTRASVASAATSTGGSRAFAAMQKLRNAPSLVDALRAQLDNAEAVHWTRNKGVRPVVLKNMSRYKYKRWQTQG